MSSSVRSKKFGNLSNFSWQYSYIDPRLTDKQSTWAFALNTDKGKYVFIPEEFIGKGFNYYYDWGSFGNSKTSGGLVNLFFNAPLRNAFAESADKVDLSKVLDDRTLKLLTQPRANKPYSAYSDLINSGHGLGASAKGYLIPDADFQKLIPQGLAPSSYFEDFDKHGSTKKLIDQIINPSEVRAFDSKKFGQIKFDGREFVYVNDTGEFNILKNFTFSFNDQYYTFIPFNLIEKGVVRDGRQFYNANLAKHLDGIQQVGEYIDLANVSWYGDLLKSNQMSTQGFLVPTDYARNNNLLDDLWYMPVGVMASNGAYSYNDITGIGKVDGQYVYILSTTNHGRTKSSSAYINTSNQYQGFWQEKPKGGALGKLVTDIAQTFASIPFFPEIVMLVSPVKSPFLYASLKGLQTAGSGGDLGDVLKSAALAAATSYVVQNAGFTQGDIAFEAGRLADMGLNSAAIVQNLNAMGVNAVTSNVAASLATAGVSAAAAPALAAGIINGGLSGLRAVATGGDLDKALTQGFLIGSGGQLSNNIVDDLIGADRVKSLATSLKMTEDQVRSIGVTAITEGITAEVSKTGDFFSVVGESLLAQGASQTAVNQVLASLNGKISDKGLAAVVTATNDVVDIGVRAAIQGTDIGTTLEQSLPYVVARATAVGLRVKNLSEESEEFAKAPLQTQIQLASLESADTLIDAVNVLGWPGVIKYVDGIQEMETIVVTDSRSWLDGWLKTVTSIWDEFSSYMGRYAGWQRDTSLETIIGFIGHTQDIYAKAGAGPEGFLAPNIEALERVKQNLTKFISAEFTNDKKAAYQILKDAENGGYVDQIISGYDAFMRAPAAFLSAGLGSTVNNLAVGVMTGGASLGMRLAAQMGLNVTAGVGGVKQEIYDTVYDAAQKAGLSQVDSVALATRSQETFGPNMDTMALAAGIAAAGTFFGIDKVIVDKGIVARSATQFAARTAAAGVSESLVTLAESLNQGVSANVAINRTPDPRIKMVQMAGAWTELGREIQRQIDEVPWNVDILRNRNVIGNSVAQALSAFVVGTGLSVGMSVSEINNLAIDAAQERGQPVNWEVLDAPTRSDLILKAFVPPETIDVIATDITRLLEAPPAPVAPVEPAGPVQPVAPVQPAGPVAPTDPNKVTSADALAYLKATGDTEGANLILQAAVGQAPLDTAISYLQQANLRPVTPVEPVTPEPVGPTQEQIAAEQFEAEVVKARAAKQALTATSELGFKAPETRPDFDPEAFIFGQDLTGLQDVRKEFVDQAADLRAEKGRIETAKNDTIGYFQNLDPRIQAALRSDYDAQIVEFDNQITRLDGQIKTADDAIADIDVEIKSGEAFSSEVSSAETTKRGFGTTTDVRFADAERVVFDPEKYIFGSEDFSPFEAQKQNFKDQVDVIDGEINRIQTRKNEATNYYNSLPSDVKRSLAGEYINSQTEFDNQINGLQLERSLAAQAVNDVEVIIANKQAQVAKVAEERTVLREQAQDEKFLKDLGIFNRAVRNLGDEVVNIREQIVLLDQGVNDLLQNRKNRLVSGNLPAPQNIEIQDAINKMLDQRDILVQRLGRIESEQAKATPPQRQELDDPQIVDILNLPEAEAIRLGFKPPPTDVDTVEPPLQQDPDKSLETGPKIPGGFSPDIILPDGTVVKAPVSTPEEILDEFNKGRSLQSRPMQEQLTGELSLATPDYPFDPLNPEETWLGGKFRPTVDPAEAMRNLTFKDVPQMQESNIYSALRQASGQGGLFPETFFAPSYYSYGKETTPTESMRYFKKGGPVQEPISDGKMSMSPLLMASGSSVPHKGAHHVQGAGGGQDDLIPAQLADGEYVFDAEIVAALGDGSNKEGAKILDRFREEIRKHKRGGSTKTIPPKAKSPLTYLRSALS